MRASSARPQTSVGAITKTGSARSSALQMSPEAKIRGDLIIAAATRVQLAADVSQAIDQPLLDVHMDVLQVHVEWEAAGFDLSADLVQHGLDLAGFLRREQSDDR